MRYRYEYYRSLFRTSFFSVSEVESGAEKEPCGRTDSGYIKWYLTTWPHDNFQYLSCGVRYRKETLQKSWFWIHKMVPDHMTTWQFSVPLMWSRVQKRDPVEREELILDTWNGFPPLQQANLINKFFRRGFLTILIHHNGVKRRFKLDYLSIYNFDAYLYVNFCPGI